MFLAQSTFAQTDFCVPGAVWSYYHPTYVGVNYETQNRYEYTGDTLIDGVFTKKIKQERRTIFPFPPYIQFGEELFFVGQSADSVFLRVDNDWELIFDYEVAQGDTRVVYIGNWADCEITDTMLIDSVYLYDFQGLSLKRIDYTMLIEDQTEVPWMPEGGWHANYTERIGFFLDGPFLQPLGCQVENIELLYAGLNCYTDTELINSGADACDVILSTPTSIQETPSNIFYSEGMLTVQNEAYSTVRVYNILGKEFLQTQITSGDQSFNIDHLPNGILLAVCTSETKRTTTRIIKIE